MRIPAHIGIIPDGNRRWAQKHGMEKQDGYSHGLSPGLELLKLAEKAGIKEITYYGFTCDNCGRPRRQVEAFSAACVKAVELISAGSVSLLVVGNPDSADFPSALIPYTRRKDLNGGGIKVNFLVNYGWDWDLSGINSPCAGRRDIFSRLHSEDVSPVDLIMRWGGMRRLSGFLPVQSVYADFYVIDSLWPDFSPEDFYSGLCWYQKQDITRGG